MGARFCILPDKLKAVFEERERTLEGKYEDSRVWIGGVQKEWNEAGSAKRRQVKRGWVKQLKNDKAWDTGTTAKESGLWREFLQQIQPS